MTPIPVRRGLADFRLGPMEPAVPRPPLTPKLNLTAVEPAAGSPLVAARNLTASTDALARAQTEAPGATAPAGTATEATPAIAPPVQTEAPPAAAPADAQHAVPPVIAAPAPSAVPAATGVATLTTVAGASVTVLGSKSGKVTLKLLGLTSGLAAPYDLSSGAASGRVQHEPLVAVLAVDAATPVLLGAAASGEALSSVSLELDADASPDFRLDLTNAHIVTAKLGWGLGSGAAQPSPPTLTVSFAYSKIEWTWVHGAKSASAAWHAT